MGKVTIRYWAAAKDAAGLPEESVAAGTLAEALDTVVASRAPETRLRDVLKRSSILLDGTRVSPVGAAETTLSDGAVIEVLPPFAGG
ncbi:MAG: MoaD/ThiS family protein [Nocardiopsaceae bacterium]|nr:MoaD/ThiS family protein [Nocardiopsaceae bacterium]